MPSSSTLRSNTPSSASPQRICASKKPRGRPGSTVSIQSATLVSSTAIGLRSTPWRQERATSRSAWRKSASDGRALGPDAGKPRGDAAGGGQQEVARAAGGIDDRELQERLGGIVRLGLGLVEHGVERGVEQRLNEAVGRVVGAGGLALVALLLGGLGGEDQRLTVIAQLGLEFEEGFIDRAQFLGLHRAPVDGDHAGFVGKPGEAVERLHEGAVAQAGGFKVGQLACGEEAAEGRKRQAPPARGPARGRRS